MLLIYSGYVPELDELLVEKLAQKGAVLTVIPTVPADYKAAAYVAEYYQELGIQAQSLSKAAYGDKALLHKALLSSKAVYLMGGNTYNFLNYARSVDLFTVLTILEANSGIIAAESAGSIILSDTIATAGLPSSDVDENTLNMTSLQSMGRLAFHISPHFYPKKNELEIDLRELQGLANESNQDVLLLEDGEGFVMSGDVIQQFIGKMKILKPQAQTDTHLLSNSLISETFSPG